MVHKKRLEKHLYDTGIIYIFINELSINSIFIADCRVLSTVPERAEEKPVTPKRERQAVSRVRASARNPNLGLRHAYPEFLPDPNPKWRNSLREKLERSDMLKRRSQIDIPEFYVGKCELLNSAYSFIDMLMYFCNTVPYSLLTIIFNT